MSEVGRPKNISVMGKRLTAFGNCLRSSVFGLPTADSTIGPLITTSRIDAFATIIKFNGIVDIGSIGLLIHHIPAHREYTVIGIDKAK